ncbi:MAG: glycosyltransferase family 2 protein [Sulfurimonas sp.]|uniref:glycosyltransferase family 2 protein n=1 Tax=Sulfurimonas sp. TaxID=2022749 RepID=UPI0025F0977A|nr:glycosyltransferase family 2 protein [Sulfurimonas sp.]MCK9455049.1 glycosyltransferase family 2 protein [Sulfurimonas sp.]
MDISAVIIVKNGALTISRTLDALKEFDDVVVYDNGSTDATVEIVKKYSNVNLIQGEFIGFGPTKNRAASFAKNDWIIIIDSDEVIDDELLATLKTKKFQKNKIYVLNFLAYYKERQIKHCGWNNQKIKRVYNKTVTKFNDNYVHENIIDTGFEQEILDGNIKHYSYHSISDFIIKVDRYSSLYATNNAGKKSSSPAKAIFNGVFSFIKTYFFKRGFLDGYAGLVIAFSHMATNFYKYIKLYELNKEEK